MTTESPIHATGNLATGSEH